MQIPKRHSIEILVENEMTEQLYIETLGIHYVLLVMGTYVNAYQIPFWSVCCVTFN